MGSVGATEVLVILIVALIVLGPSRLPEAARQVGRAISELRRAASGLQNEMRDAFSEVPATPAASAPAPVLPPLPEAPPEPPPAATPPETSPAPGVTPETGEEEPGASPVP